MSITVCFQMLKASMEGHLSFLAGKLDGKKFKGVVAGAAAGVAMAGMAVVAGTAQAEPVVSSFYGYELAGSPTASGVPFDPEAMTAAHPSLPFGTQLEVCYQGCVTVTVNDRGPFVEGRGLDLSQGAAHSIGLYGVDTVDVTVLGGGGDVSGGAATDVAVADQYAAETYDPSYDAAATGYYDPYTGYWVSY